MAVTVLAFVIGPAVPCVSFSAPLDKASAIVEIKPETRRILPGQEPWLGAERGGLARGGCCLAPKPWVRHIQ